ncbi:MAG: SIR2 family protein [Dehalococcoidales bacterium]|nr:MAG: SIR2 family protein [Dehalococcoidales bacterium]
MLRLVDFLILGQEQLQPSIVRRRRTTTDVSSVAWINETLQVLFGLLSSRMLPADPNVYHQAISDFVSAHPSAAIVTTNYDCCIDLALLSQKIDFTYMVDFSNIAHNAAETKLVKLHGSLNWFYCETCQSTRLENIEEITSRYKKGEALYPVIAVCKECGGQYRGLLVPPLAMKFDVAPPLTSLLGVADEAFQRSDLIVVVGFSFADADLYISRMICKALQMSASAKMVIFDPDYSVANTVRRRFSIRIPRFDAKRILAVRGDCENTLRDFLAGNLLVKAKTKIKSKSKREPKKVPS